MPIACAGCVPQVGIHPTNAEQFTTMHVTKASGESAEQKKLRGNKHRMREEEALRALDVVAAAEHRAKRAKHMHDQRQQEDEVAGVLERVLAAVCRYADLEERRGPARRRRRRGAVRPRRGAEHGSDNLQVGNRESS